MRGFSRIDVECDFLMRDGGGPAPESGRLFSPLPELAWRTDEASYI